MCDSYTPSWILLLLFVCYCLVCVCVSRPCGSRFLLRVCLSLLILDLFFLRFTFAVSRLLHTLYILLVRHSNWHQWEIKFWVTFTHVASINRWEIISWQTHSTGAVVVMIFFVEKVVQTGPVSKTNKQKKLKMSSEINQLRWEILNSQTSRHKRKKIK